PPHQSLVRTDLMSPRYSHHHIPPSQRSTLFPYTTLFRSPCAACASPEPTFCHGSPRRYRWTCSACRSNRYRTGSDCPEHTPTRTFPRRPCTPSWREDAPTCIPCAGQDRKSTRLNSSHVSNSYAVFRLK